MESSNEESWKPNEEARIISRSSSQSTSPPAKKRKRGNVDKVDEAILKILASSQDTQMDNEEFFGRNIGAALRR